MSISVEGQSCPVCHSYLFDDDDIVFCPICGAPHHRDCYNRIGHCALEDSHGTDRQYDASKFRNIDTQNDNEQQKKNEQQTDNENTQQTDTKEETCRFCGSPLDADANFCPHCRAPRMIGVTQLDPFGGIKSDSEIEGVKANEIAKFTVVNTPRYVRKFFMLSKKNKVSWNWAAFLFPCAWAFYRKCYRSGILMGMLLVAAAIFQIPLSTALSHYTLESGGYAEIVRLITDNIDKIGILPIALMAVCAVLSIVIRVVSGAYGDYIYRQTALSKIHEIKESDADVQVEYSKRGGVNFLWFLLSYMSVTYIPYLIEMFIK